MVIWNAFVVGLGLLAGTHLEWAKDMLVRYNTIAGIVVAVAVVAGLGVVLYRRYARPSSHRPLR